VRSLVGSVYDNLTADRERWVLWLPVGLAIGIGGYFLLAHEPPLWVGPAVVAGGLTGYLLALRSRPQAGMGLVLFVSLSGGVMGLGFASAQLRTLIVSAPVLARTVSSATISGRVALVEHFPDGARITLEKPRISKIENHDLPERIRIRLRGNQPMLEPGDWITGRARVAPPSAPALPDGFDFQRHAFFSQIGGFGFSFGPVSVTAKAADIRDYSLRLWVSRTRDALTARILKGLAAPLGGIAAALMTGEKHAVDRTITEDLRNSGLAHLLAISGLHIGLIAGIVFTGLRFALVLVPGLALRQPIKKWAALAAMAAAFAYAVLAGATLPTQRAFLMAAIALTAVLLDRRGISLRAVAWTAFAVLLVQPESLLGPSFQMSFAAAAALVAGYEGWKVVQQNRLRMTTNSPSPGLAKSVGRYVGGVCLTTLIASAATAPFALYHFNQFADFSLFANLLAVPLTALWVMPWAVVAFIVMPFGLEAWALLPMGWGIEGVITIAKTVAGWPGAVTRLPAIPNWGIVIVALAGVWLIIWRQRWRFLAVPGLLLGMASFALVATPDVVIDGQARFFAIKTADGAYRFSNLRKARGDRELWLRHLGVNQPLAIEDSQANTTDTVAIRCDGIGCLYEKSALTVAIAQAQSALLEDCWRADVVIAFEPIRRACPAAQLIDWFDLWRNGTHALWITPSGVKIRSARDGRGNRPWVLTPTPAKPDKPKPSGI